MRLPKRMCFRFGFLSLGLLMPCATGLAEPETAAPSAAVIESARSIPVVAEVDVVVVGGSTGAVSAAIAAKEAGAKVFLLAPRPYLGHACASRAACGWKRAKHRPPPWHASSLRQRKNRRPAGWCSIRPRAAPEFARWRGRRK